MQTAGKLFSINTYTADNSVVRQKKITSKCLLKCSTVIDCDTFEIKLIRKMVNKYNRKFQACYEGYNVLIELESSIIRSLKGNWIIIYRALFFLVVITVTIISQKWSWLIVVILAACPPTPHLMICVQRMITSAVRTHAAYPSLSKFCFILH